MRYLHFAFSELRVHCHCVSCSENNECLSRGQCKTGYWGDNCMLYDILQSEMERQQTVYMTNSYTFNRTAEVDGNTIIYL